MNLLNKTTERLKYFSPTAEIIEVEDDIITKSIPVAKLSLEELVEESKKKEQTKQLTFFEKYPDGLSLEVLKLIDFKHFGAKLKQEQLLPPSYDRKPIEIDLFLDAENIPNVELVFKSKTSSCYMVVNIHKYNVACSKNRSYALAVNSQISEVWCKFAENVMWAWDRGYNFALVGLEKNIETYRKPRVDETTITKLKEIESGCNHYCIF